MTDPIKKMLEKRHPDHSAYELEWLFLNSAEAGGPSYALGNLFKHPFEESAIYKERQERAADHHFNLTRLVIDSYEGYLFQKTPILDDGCPASLQVFNENATQDDRTLEDFAKEVGRKLLKFGSVWVAVDKPANPAPGQALTAAEEAELNLFPYAYTIDPINVLDGRLENGEAAWLLVREDSRNDETPESSGDPIVRFRVWEKHRIRLYEPGKDANGTDVFNLIEDRINELGVVPIVPVFFGKTAGFYSPGLVSDIAHIDRAVFNKASLLDEIHFKVTFPQLTVPYGGSLFDGDGLSGEGNSIISMGLNKVIPYEAGTGSPAYMHYPAEPAVELAKSIKEMILSAVSQALLDGELAVEGTKSTGSGVSKSYSFEKLNKRLATIAGTLEAAFKKVLILVAQWQKDDVAALPKLPYDFPDSFEVKSLTQEVADIIGILGSGIQSATFTGQVYKKLVRLAIPKMTSEMLDQVDLEIDQAVADEYQMKQIQMEGLAAAGEQAAGGLSPADEKIAQTATGKVYTAASALEGKEAGTGQTL